MKSFPTHNFRSDRSARFRLRTCGLLLFLSLFVTSCTKDLVTSRYSTEHYVNIVFSPISAFLPLQQVLGSPGFGNPGECAVIRKYSTKVTITSSTQQAFDCTDALVMRGSLGCGGLIVGTDYDSQYYAYDLACPNCNQAQFRLTVPFDGRGIVTCDHCHISYNLNNYGSIQSTEGNTLHSNPRGLFCYQITYDGTSVTIYN